MNTTEKTTRAPESRCSRCQAQLATDARMMIGEIVICASCGTQHEVVEPDPVRLAPRAKIEEEDEDFADWAG